MELAFYRLQRVNVGSDQPGRRVKGAYVVSPTETGTGDPEEDKAPLSEIIERLNERFGTNFTDADRYFFEQVRAQAVQNELVRETARANHAGQVQPGGSGSDFEADDRADERERCAGEAVSGGARSFKIVAYEVFGEGDICGGAGW